MKESFSFLNNSFWQGVPEEGTYCKAPWLEWQLPGVNRETAQALAEAVFMWEGGVSGRRSPLPGCEGAALVGLARRLRGRGFLW